MKTAPVEGLLEATMQRPSGPRPTLTAHQQLDPVAAHAICLRSQQTPTSLDVQLLNTHIAAVLHSSGYCQAPTWVLSYAHDAVPSTLAIKVVHQEKKRAVRRREEEEKGKGFFSLAGHFREKIGKQKAVKR